MWCRFCSFRSFDKHSILVPCFMIRILIITSINSMIKLILNIILLSFYSSHFSDYPFGIRLIDSYDETRVLIELAAHTEEDRSAFLTELGEVMWVFRSLENDRIGSLGVSDKIGQSTLSLHVSLRYLQDRFERQISHISSPEIWEKSQGRFEGRFVIWEYIVLFEQHIMLSVTLYLVFTIYWKYILNSCYLYEWTLFQSFNSDTDGGRRHTHTLGRRFFKSNLFKSGGSKRDVLSPSSSLFYTQGVSSSDIRSIDST